LQDVPAGWSTPVGFGSSRRTDCQSDRLGRSTLVLGPAHLVPTKNEAGAVVAVFTRRADFACYLDGKREVRSAKGGSTLGGFYTLGTVTLRRLNFANRELEVIEAARACECGPLSPTEVFPQSAWKRWRREFHNAAEYRDESRVWHAIPVTGEGFENVNYYATRYGRDAMGRENRVASPGGTIHRSVIDARGNPSSKWIGTNDTGATNTDPTGGGATGNNLVKVATHVYDNGADGGNGNLTSVIRPVDGNSANDRTETFTYDFRDRLTGVNRSDGTNTYLDRFTLDNRGNTTQTDAYHTSVAAAKRPAAASACKPRPAKASSSTSPRSTACATATACKPIAEKPSASAPAPNPWPKSTPIPMPNSSASPGTSATATSPSSSCATRSASAATTSSRKWSNTSAASRRAKPMSSSVTGRRRSSEPSPLSPPGADSGVMSIAGSWRRQL
jgi:YD repeat-containing protein